MSSQPSDWSGLTGVPPGGSGATCGASAPLRGGRDGGGAAPFSPVPGFGCGSAAEGGFGAKTPEVVNALQAARALVEQHLRDARSLPNSGTAG